MKGISEIIATILMLMITLGVSGTAYLFISGTLTQQSQGIEIVDAFCSVQGSTETTNILVRNLGTSDVNSSKISVVQTAPSTTVSLTWSANIIEPGKTVTLYDTCEGSGSRSCIYRIVPPAGRSILATVSCT